LSKNFSKKIKEYFMNRIALSDRLEGMSKIFADGNPIAEDLKAMAFTLRNTTDEKFASVLNSEFEADKLSGEEVEAYDPGTSTWSPAERGQHLPSGAGGRKYSPAERAKVLDEWAKKEGILPKALASLKNMLGVAPAGSPSVAPARESSEEGIEVIQEVEASEDAGLFWTKEATDYITANLVRNVLGMEKATIMDTKRHLTPAQVPDGGHAGQKAPTLKPEQVPDQEYLDSGIVEKSHGAVKKEATEECNMDNKKHEEKETPKEEAKEKAEKPAEEAKEEKAKKEEVEANTFTTDASTYTVEGIELSGSMDEVDPSSEEIQKLSTLFN
jgi:hypothetical protein